MVGPTTSVGACRYYLEYIGEHVYLGRLEHGRQVIHGRRVMALPLVPSLLVQLGDGPGL